MLRLLVYIFVVHILVLLSVVVCEWDLGSQQARGQNKSVENGPSVQRLSEAAQVTTPPRTSRHASLSNKHLEITRNGPAVFC